MYNTKEIMKKLIFMVAISILVVSCKNGGSSDVHSGIIIKGTISGKQSVSQKVKAESTSSLSDAVKVLVISNRYYKLYDIVNGSFSVTGELGTGVALIFLDSNNKYIGNLSSQGLNMLPLGSLTNGGNTAIDLSTLTLVGTNVIPSHDPLGKEIIISDAEINSFKAIGGYYASIAKNIDSDNDGIPDVLSDKQLIIFSQFARYSGKWGLNATAPVPTDSAHSYINYSVNINGGSGLTFSNGNIVLSGPGVSPYTDITTWGSKLNQGGGFISSFNRQTSAPMDAPWGTTFLPFKMGTYTLTLDGNRLYTLEYSNIDAQYNLVIVAPTIHTNSDGKITSLSFDYKLPNGTVINPACMLTDVMVQFFDSSKKQLFNSPRITQDMGFNTFNFSTPLDISTLDQIDVWYDDLLGNSYDIIWR